MLNPVGVRTPPRRSAQERELSELQRQLAGEAATLRRTRDELERDRQELQASGTVF